MANSLIVAKREYLARVRTKGFWIGTIALPLIMGALVILPSLLLLGTETSHRLVVVDETGELGQRLVAELSGGRGSAVEDVASFELTLESPDADVEALRSELNRRVLEDEIDAWLWIDEEGLEKDEIEYHAESVSNFLTQERLERSLSKVVRIRRLEQAGYDAEEIGRLARFVGLETIRVTEQGDKEEGAEAGIILAYVLFMLLYLVLLIYGQQVMNGVLEEKTSRIVEVILSTTRPFDLMLGKLVGVCLTALTQLAIWLGTMAVLTLPGIVATMAWIPEDVGVPTLGIGVLVHFLVNFLLGFFLFSTFYAAIGAAFNNMQEAQQFASIAVIFLIAPMVLMLPVINDPDSTVSVVASLIPLFTPLLMMLRIAVKMPPWWQVAAGYLLTGLFTWLMIWLGARIYRIGILMYGKKPNLQELWRWLRYA